MEITISKEEFERILPVAACAHEEAFEKSSAHFERSLNYALETFFDDPDNTVFIEDEKIKQDLITFVALHSFLAVFRQLDLVLTPTGFGVVSNDVMAPASKQRVDALISNVQWLLQDAESALLQHLVKVEGWGESNAAKTHIRSLVYCQRVLCRLLRRDSRDPNFYNDNMKAIGEADFKIQQLISPEMFEEVLVALRSNKLEGKMLEASHAMLKVYELHLMVAPALEHQACRSLIDFMDKHPEEFATYHSSAEYKALHFEREKNTRDSSAYIFG